MSPRVRPHPGSRLRLRAGAPRGEGAARPRRVRFRRRPLRPDERPDVGRAASALEAVHAVADRAARRAIARSTSPVAPAISRPAWRGRSATRASSCCRDINAAMLAIGRDRLLDRGILRNLSRRARERRAAAVPRRDLRLRDDRLRSAQRHRQARGARVDEPRAAPRRAAAGPRVLAARGRRAEAAVRRLFVQRAAVARRGASRATRRATAISPNRSAASPTRRRCSA